jgi:hypothetical protein
MVDIYKIEDGKTGLLKPLFTSEDDDDGADLGFLLLLTK